MYCGASELFHSVTPPIYEIYGGLGGEIRAMLEGDDAL
jgi:hypothetical protein